MSKAIYQPKGKAQEYNQWAVNFFNGCSGKCTYCFNRKGRGAKILGADTPTIKKTLKDPETALKTFERELAKNLIELQKHGLFFNFVSDPFLPETILVNQLAMRQCFLKGVPVIALTKQAAWVSSLVAEIINNGTIWNTNHDFDFAVGFTLTGHDELEPGCSTNDQRIEAMKQLSEVGVRTWASIEPIIDFGSSLEMIKQALPYCSHFKIGLQSGVKYDPGKLAEFVEFVNNLIAYDNNRYGKNRTLYWKDSIARQLTTGDKHLVYYTSEPFIVNSNYKFWSRT